MTARLEVIEVRGEVYFDRREFTRINAAHARGGLAALRRPTQHGRGVGPCSSIRALPRSGG